MTEKTFETAIETDVVVVGYGGAGATAAITAHDNGARVIILEKMPTGGGNSRLASGHLFHPTSMEVVKHLEVLCFGKTDTEVIQRFVEYAMKSDDWIRQIGGEAEVYPVTGVLYPFPFSPCWPNVPAAEHIEFHKVTGEAGDEGPAGPFWRLLRTNVERRPIKVMTNTPARELFTNERGEVIGVIAGKDGEQVRIEAKRAVILTCGGFEYNEAMKDAFLPLTPLYAVGNPGNTGDGITMAQKIGAALWHMYSFQGYPMFKAPEYQAAFQIRFHSPRFIYIDKDGRRFTNETGWEPHEGWKGFTTFMPYRRNYPHLPAYAIFDEATRRRGPLYAVKSGANYEYKWSLDNSKEIAKGWIKQGKTIRELATQISVGELTLEDTITRYNGSCKAGNDAEFGRSREVLEPIEPAPYYAIELWPGIITTIGGPRRDKEARVLNNEGKPIPRLYSAGELGSIWGSSLEGGAGLTDCLVFGRIAGQNAAAEKPR